MFCNNKLADLLHITKKSQTLFRDERFMILKEQIGKDIKFKVIKLNINNLNFIIKIKFKCYRTMFRFTGVMNIF